MKKNIKSYGIYKKKNTKDYGIYMKKKHLRLWNLHEEKTLKTMESI